MRIALVIPNYRYAQKDSRFLWSIFPYNVCMLASEVYFDNDIIIIDAYTDDLSYDDLIRQLCDFKPDIVGITTMMDQCANALHTTANYIKLNFKNTMIIAGGVYSTVNHELVSLDKNIDMVVRGDGELALKDIVLGKNITQELNIIDNLDILNYPRYELIDFYKYANLYSRKSVDSPSKTPYGRIITSRGCKYRCCFCQVKSISGLKWRPRSVSNVISELKWLIHKYGIKSYIIDDDNFLCNRERAYNLFSSIIKQNLVLPWKAIATAVFHLDKELLLVLRESGCEYLDFAIESGVERVLKDIIHKPVNLLHAKEMVDFAKSIGIYISANFIIGFPGESWDEIRESIKFAEYLDADYTKIFCATPLKKTELWNKCQEQEMFIKEFKNENLNWNKAQIQSKEWTDKDLTILRCYEWDRINFSCNKKKKKTAEMMNISIEELDKQRADTRNGIKA